MALTSRQKQARRLWKMRALGLGYEDGGGGGGGGGGITFVGSSILGVAGATSGTTSINLNSGTLTGGASGSVSPGDLVIAVSATGSNVDRTLSITDGSSEYTLFAELFSDDSRDTNLRVAYKFMGNPVDSAVLFGPSQSTVDAQAIAVYVFSGVDQTTPLDVSTVTATGINGVLADPPSISPSTAGAFVVAVGAGGHSNGGQTYTSPDLTSFVSVGEDGATHDVTIGIGHFPNFVSGSVDPAAFTFSGSNNAVYSWAAMSIALRPVVS